MTTSGCAVQWGRETGDSLEDLTRRLALTLPGDTVRGGFFLGTLELVRAAMGEAGVRRCLAAVDTPRFMDFFQYPLSTFLRLNEAAAAELAPGGGGWARVQRGLGRRWAVDLLASATGRTLVLLSRGETRRLLGNLPSAYRAAANHGQRSVVWEGECRGRVLMRRDFLPCAFHEGVLGAVLESTRARGVCVEGTRLDVLDSEYRVEWE